MLNFKSSAFYPIILYKKRRFVTSKYLVPPMTVNLILLFPYLKAHNHSIWILFSLCQTEVTASETCDFREFFILGQTSSTSQACKWNYSSVYKKLETMIYDEIQGLVGSRSKPVDSIIPNCLTDETYAALSAEDEQQMFDKIWSNYFCSEEHVIMLGKNDKITISRITGTKARDVLVRRADTMPDTLVRNIMGYSKFDISRKPAVKWGISKGKTFFLISTDDSFFSAYSDGHTKCKCCGKEVIEIRCPYNHNGSLDLTLKATHIYFTHVQLQIDIHEVQYCDFVVFTCNKLCITRRYLMSLVLPEIGTREHENGIIDAARNDNVATYCICDQQNTEK
ncbi:hypothetical protein ACJMK2_015663 [Sinanodonta woodiana]|uniref:Uncharacterized protein n=1 Tax=Sinanodonta woodiana TaxID=1069815 RepID=A0ABD3UUW6_SINWO